MFLPVDISADGGQGARQIYNALQVLHDALLEIVVEAEQSEREDQQVILARILAVSKD